MTEGTEQNVSETGEMNASQSSGDQGILEFVPGPNAVDISPDKDGGLYKEIIKEGEGDDFPADGEKVFVHYVGQLLDGTVFDSSRDRNEKFDFVLGKGAVIKGWDVGVATMKRGEVSLLTCKPDYAYGSSGSPPKIPPNATLQFEIELIDWKLEDLSPSKDGSICRRLVQKGEGYSTPNDGATVNVHVTGRHEGRIFEDRELTFVLGEGCEAGVVEGLDIALQKFKKGEKSKIKLHSKYAFGKDGHEDFKIPPDSNVEYEVHLKSFENAKEPWELDSDEKLEQAEITKTKGTQFYKADKYKLAIKQYKRVIDLLQHESGLDDEKELKCKSLLVAGYLNLALCYLKIEEYSDAVKSCDKAMELEPDNEKGLFRRGQARLAMNDFEMAKEDFGAVIKIDPNNKAARNQITLCNQKIRQQIEKERKTYKNMFEKFSKQDKTKGGSITPIPKPKKEPAESDPSTWPGPNIEEWNNKANVKKEGEPLETVDTSA